MSAIPHLGVYADTRIGGVTEWIYGDPRRVSMRMPDWSLDCVGYLCVEDTTGKKISGGTFFFLCVDSEIHSRVYVYAVTARHCIEGIAQNNIDMYLKLNTSDGGFGFIKVAVAAWIFPESLSSDIAILKIMPPPPFVVKALPFDCLATNSVIEQESIGIGDELYITGLFIPRQGLQRNIPLLRSGILSAMPGEIDGGHGDRYTAYLAEIRSLRGLSGSPVYVMVHSGRKEKGAPLTVDRKYYLLGIIRGHWDQSQSTLDGATEKINVGIAIVTPAVELADLLLREDLASERRLLDDELSAENAPTMD